MPVHGRAIRPDRPKAGLWIPCRAINRPATDNVESDGRFRSPAELGEKFTRAGAREGIPIGAYCGSGVTAAHEVLALELAGFPGAALYAGSWSHWITDPGRPVAVGD